MELIKLVDGSYGIKGRNLLKKSYPLILENWVSQSSPASTIDANVLYEGKPTVKTYLGAGLIYCHRGINANDPSKWIPMIVGQTYTYSMCIKVTDTVTHNNILPLHFHFANPGDTSYVNPNNIKISGTMKIGEWSIISSTFKSSKEYMRPIIFTAQNPATPVNIAWIKLEYGDTRTEPSAAPEDVGDVINEDIKYGILDNGSLFVKGRNLALNSSPNKVDSNDYQFLVIRLASLPEHGQDFTIQIWGKLSPEMTAFRAYCHSGNGNLVPGDFVKTDYGYICKGTWKSKYTDTNGLHEYDDPYLYVYQLYLDQLTSNTKSSIEKVMVTFGHDEYAYSPAPEDMEGVS